MSWKKYFTPVNTSGKSGPISGSMSSGGSGSSASRTNYSSYLPDVYAGHPNRLERFSQYDTMDSDSECNAALDILAEFCCQPSEDNQTPFHIKFNETGTSTEIKIIKKYLQQWTKLNKFDIRIFKIVRNVFKYGDAFFVRDPETQTLMYVDPSKVDSIIVNESEGKKPEQYKIRGFNPNFETLATTAIQPSNSAGGANQFGGNYGSGGAAGGARGMTGSFPTGASGSRFTQNQNQYSIDAKHVVHLSLSEGLDNNYPFGTSLMENIFKVFKQKELLEDAIIIYRVQRAPERRVFYIDVGNMPSHLAMGFVERVKNEVNQRRIPSTTGGSQTVVDSGYNPLSTNEDYFFPQTSEGRGSKVEILPGGCFAMNTQVSLLDGRELSIADIRDEMAAGKELWTYSCEPKTGAIVPGLISWAGVTQKSAKVMRLTLDNGETITCTPDHKFPIYGSEQKMAGDFVIGESLIPLYRKKEPVAYGKNTYEQVFDNATKTWVFTHRLVADYLKDTVVGYKVHDANVSDGKYQVRHHVDYNRYNNDPNNLVWMNSKDHVKYHSDSVHLMNEHNKYVRENDPVQYAEICKRRSDSLKHSWATLSEEEHAYRVGLVSSSWKNHTTEEYESRCAKIGLGIHNHVDELSEEEREARAARSRAAFKLGNIKFNEMMVDDLEYRKSVVDKRMLHWTEENRAQRGEFISEQNKISWSGTAGEVRRENQKTLQSVDYSHAMLLAVIDLVKGKTTHQVTANDVVNELNNNIPLLTELRELNQFKKVRNWSLNDGFTVSGLVTLVKRFGYESWKDFRVKESIHNHRVVKIEYLEDPMEVGTLTIDFKEIHHSYHNFALTAGVLSQNSNLGEIDDLRYFTNKLFRALRIPSSYLPTGADDGGSSFNDGRVGTAYIQELRFNKYCERLQSLLNGPFDLEFKLYLHNKGINIDNNIFDIKFNPPQNFAAYRQSEMDTARVSTFSTMVAVPFMSKRYAMKRFLGLSAEEIAENETMWREENVDAGDNLSAGSELRNAGVTADGMAGDISSLSSDQEVPLEGEEGAEPGAAPAATKAPAQ